MTDEATSARALIDAYKTCARPNAAAEAQMWATLAAAERAAKARARARPSRAPWFALAAGLLLAAAWLLDLPRYFASGHVLKDMRDQAEYEARPAPPEEARAREPASQPAATMTVAPAPRQAGEPERARPVPRDGSSPRRGSAAPQRRAADSNHAARDPGDGDRVLAEMALLQQARVALRGGRPGEALELLARHAETFARGSMAEERLALRVLALCAAGETARGAAEAATFLRAHPRSTYAGRIESACSEKHEPRDTSKIP